MRRDRWFRSVADYYKVMEVLEAHNCGWKTTQEQYDTSTAGGRLYINLRLQRPRRRWSAAGAAFYCMDEKISFAIFARRRQFRK